METKDLGTAGRCRESVIGFNKSLHGARGLFALMVFVFHVFNSGLPTWPALQTTAMQFVLGSTEYGVELFFCISGYVICGTLRRARSPGAFLEDRIIRIYPSLWASIFVIVVVGLVSGQHGFDSLDRRYLSRLLLTSLLALPGILPGGNLNPVGWSLSYEMCFYLVCALAWQLRLRMCDRAAIAAVPVAAVMLTFYPRAIFLLAGVLVAEGVGSTGWAGRSIRLPLPCLLMFLMSWRLIDVSSAPQDLTTTTLVSWASDLRLPLMVVAFTAATLGLAGVAAGHGALGRVLRTSPFQYLGTISYSFYLWHIIIMAPVKLAMLRTGLAADIGPASQAVFFVLTLPLSLLIAHVCQGSIERGVEVRLRRQLHHPVPLAAAAKRPA